MCYRLLFQIYGIYGLEWKSYPLLGLFACITTLNAFILARRLKPPQNSVNGWWQVLKLTFRLSAQFLLGMLASTFLIYKLLPWFNKQDGYIKVAVAAFSPIVTPKAISRIGAQRLESIHPGTAHVFVSMLYGTGTISLRILQADMNTLALYIALSVVHGIVDVLERLAITMRDNIWEYLLNRLFRKYRSPRSRRFMANLSIQIMLQEATALLSALGFVQLYVMYGDFKPSNTTHDPVHGDFFIRATTGLFKHIA
ncbi:uncharacterized protein LOC110242740 [Exaiptasia diaphana]|uniref:Uncharacterized protein n=1 Tax=Exaiptasia diaphana TaxID=2652724 RepID=A0A913XHN3_EXADI|nr:uncharacterized protein LOC110242740 [Exaiptasia diaphana]